jgi:hypothetical protein
MTRFMFGLTIAGFLAWAPTAGQAADQPAYPPLTPNAPTWPSPQTESKLRGAIEQMVDAFTDLMREVPRYAAPEINENGDIILRRLPPPEAAPSAPRLTPRQDEDRT